MDNKSHYLKLELEKRLSQDSVLFEWLEQGCLDGVWYWDLENPNEEWMSPKFKKVFGYEDEEIPNTPEWWQKNIFEEDLPAVLDNFEKHCADPNHLYDQVVRYKHKDGNTVWIRCRGKVIFNDAGKPIRMIGAHIDMTSLMQAKLKQEELLAELEHWAGARQSIFDSMLDSIIVIDQVGKIVEVNKATCTIFGYESAELIGQNIKLLMGENDAQSHDSYLKNHTEKGTQNIIGKGREVLAKKRSGEMFYVHLSIAKFSIRGSSRFVGTLKDIDDSVRKRQELELSVNRDHLTGLYSRKRLEQQIELFISESIRKSQKFIIFFIDLNKFKCINDLHGHDVGDSVLKIIANRMSSVVRESDCCARFGGDEFVIAYSPSSRSICADTIQNKLFKKISEPMHINGLNLNVTASIGFAVYPEHGKTLDKLLNYADQKMYAKKLSNVHLEIVENKTEKDLVAVTYMSDSLINDDELAQECSNIERSASLHNASKRISGILLCCRHRFIQRLEGPRGDIDFLVERIKKDRRHRNFTLLSYNTISDRVNSDWSHMSVVVKDSELDDLEQFLINVEQSEVMSDIEARFFVDYIKNFQKTDRTMQHIVA